MSLGSEPRQGLLCPLTSVPVELSGKPWMFPLMCLSRWSLPNNVLCLCLRLSAGIPQQRHVSPLPLSGSTKAGPYRKIRMHGRQNDDFFPRCLPKAEIFLSVACVFLVLPPPETSDFGHAGCTILLSTCSLFLFFFFFFSFFLLRFLKRISLFDVGINAGMGMPWRGCEGQRRAWVFILGVHFVSDRLCSFSTTHTHSRPAVSTSCHPRRALILQVLSLRAWLLLMGLQIHSGSHASTFATELFPQPLPPFVRLGLRIPRWP